MVEHDAVVEPVTRIISASRRTELPGYHAEECVARLRRLRKPVHSVFFWTRYPAALCGRTSLGELVRYGIENPFVHLTVTGQGGTRLEPRVPSTEQVIGQLDSLIDALGSEPQRILWRFDPLLRGITALETFAELAVQFGSRGVRSCITSFPAYMSLKGPLDEQYQQFGIVRWGRQEKREFALRLNDVATKHGLTLTVCNQPNVVQDTCGAVAAAACISGKLAERLHPRRLPLDLPKDPSQRKHCNCVVSHDIGKYTDLCRSGCVYCYSKAGGPREDGAPSRHLR